MEKELAAGGVVFRELSGKIQLLFIKDRYGKWALPKGKLEQGETSETAALREICEETPVDGEIVTKLHSIEYQYQHPSKGLVDKNVDYYLVKALCDDILPQVGEVLEVVWVDLREGIAYCDYVNNLEVLQRATDYFNASGTV